MARQNYKSGNSILSRLDTQHANAGRNIINQLAAHGMIFSGDTGYRQGVENQQYGNNIYDAKSNLLGSLNQDYQSYLGQKNSLQQMLTNAIQQGYYNQLANAQYAGYGGGGGGGGYGGGATATSQTQQNMGGGQYGYQKTGSPLGWFYGGRKTQQPAYGGATWAIHGSGTQVGHS